MRANDAGDLVVTKVTEGAPFRGFPRKGLDGVRIFRPKKMTLPSINGMNFMGFHGISWDFMGFHGISWGFMGFHGVSWDFMGFHGVSSVVSDVIGFFWDPHVVTIGFLRQDSRSIGRDDGMIWVTPHVTTINHHH